MKVEGWLFLGCAAFFAGADVVYWHFSKDPTGTTALALSVGPRLPHRFLPPVHRPAAAARGRRTTRTARSREGTGELGFFSPHSWWPLFTGMSAAVAALGAAIGWWLFLIGVLFVLLSAIGFVFEYYRGQYAH